MMHPIRTLLIAIMIGVIGLATGACAGGEAPVADSQDEAGSDVAVEAQAVAEATATNTAAPAPTPAEESGDAELPTEIIEPVSPVSPVATPEESMSRSIPAPAELPSGSETAYEAAVADLSEQTGVPADQIELVSIEAVEWRDSSLGCPQEGMMYAQVITPGFRMVLAADGQEYEYHTNQSDTVVLCQE